MWNNLGSVYVNKWVDASFMGAFIEFMLFMLIFFGLRYFKYNKYSNKQYVKFQLKCVFIYLLILLMLLFVAHWYQDMGYPTAALFKQLLNKHILMAKLIVGGHGFRFLACSSVEVEAWGLKSLMSSFFSFLAFWMVLVGLVYVSVWSVMLKVYTIIFIMAAGSTMKVYKIVKKEMPPGIFSVEVWPQSWFTPMSCFFLMDIIWPVFLVSYMVEGPFQGLVWV